MGLHATIHFSSYFCKIQCLLSSQILYCVWVVAPCSLVGGYQHFIRACCLSTVNASTLKMETVCSFDTLIPAYQTRQCRNQEDQIMFLYFGSLLINVLILNFSTPIILLATPLHHYYRQDMLACHHLLFTNSLMTNGMMHFVPTLYMNTNSTSKHWALSPSRQSQHHQEKGEYR